MRPGKIVIKPDRELKLAERSFRRARDMQDVGVDKMGKSVARSQRQCLSDRGKRDS